jgi:hypothetical protein
MFSEHAWRFGFTVGSPKLWQEQMPIPIWQQRLVLE